MTERCPGCDPILHAAAITCGQCKAESWPIDADWFGEDLVLATYESAHEPGCLVRYQFGTILLDLRGDGSVPPVHRPRLCRAIASTTGKPCRGYARPGSAYCHSHQRGRRVTA